jgi:hypothetical protein
VGGYIMRYNTERTKMMFDVLKARDTSMDLAAKRTKDGGTWMRRALYFLMAGMFLAVLVAPFVGLPVAVEVEVSKGILFWKHTVKEFVEVTGVLLPIETRKALLMFLAFYLGQGIK